MIHRVSIYWNHSWIFGDTLDDPHSIVFDNNFAGSANGNSFADNRIYMT